MKTVTKSLLLAATLLISSNCLADWNGGIEAGAQLGSTDKPALRFFASNNDDPLSHYVYVDWIRESGSSNYRLGYQPTFRISHSVYSFGRFSIEDDDPSLVDQEIDLLVGVGNNLFKRGSTQVKVETGLGARQISFDDSDNKTEEGFFFLAGNLSTGVLPIVRFDATIDTKTGGDQTTLDAEAGFSIPIGPATSLRYVYSAKRYNLGSSGETRNEDTFFKITHGF